LAGTTFGFSSSDSESSDESLDSSFFCLDFCALLVADTSDFEIFDVFVLEPMSFFVNIK
jgi:hypothetical protein